MKTTRRVTETALLALAVSGITAAGNAMAEVQPPQIADIAAATYPCSGTVFNDVDSNHWACGYIEEFLTLNITQGCQADDPNTPQNEAAYCPGATVTRDQMAIFFVKALEQTLFDILDGAGNGLDADLLDGQHGSYYLDWNNLTNVPTDIANGDADTLGFMVCGDGEVPKYQNTTLSWVCGNDYVGTGDITAVIAGTGLTGSATSGDATLSVAVPLSLSGASAGAVVSGTNSTSTGSPIGVLGTASNAGSATSTGVKGMSSSSVGTGVWGEAPMVGLYGKGTASGNSSWGVFGEAAKYGVYGKATGTGTTGSYYGVYGESPLIGVYGKSTAGGWGIVSEGTALINGNLSVQGVVDWAPLTANLSVPAAAFHQADAGSYGITYKFTNWGMLVDQTGSNFAEYVAPVMLPDGATVTKVTFYWQDGSNNNGNLSLQRVTLANGNAQAMASVSSSGGSSTTAGQTIVEGSSVDTTINLATIDNANYHYYLDFLPNGGDGNGYSTWLKGVVITYTTTGPH